VSCAGGIVCVSCAGGFVCVCVMRRRHCVCRAQEALLLLASEPCHAPSFSGHLAGVRVRLLSCQPSVFCTMECTHTHTHTHTHTQPAAHAPRCHTLPPSRALLPYEYLCTKWWRLLEHTQAQDTHLGDTPSLRASLPYKYYCIVAPWRHLLVHTQEHAHSTG
jgi:hypothetical protein